MALTLGLNTPGSVLAFSSITGAVFNGTTDCFSALSTAITNAGSTPTSFSVTGPMLLGTNITIPSNIQLWFVGTGKIKPAANVTVTINASIVAGPWPIFDCSNSGSVITGLLKPLFGHLYTEQWGALGDGATSDVTAFNACSKAALDAGCVPIRLLARTYALPAQVIADGAPGFVSPSWYGANKQKTILDFSGASAGVESFKMTGGSGKQAGAVVQDIAFKGNSGIYGPTMSGKNGVRLIRCLYDTFAEGRRNNNELTGSFTEDIVDENPEFHACTIDLRYMVAAGNNSFRRSGIINRGLTNRASGTCVQVDNGCEPYFSPLDITLGVTGAVTLVNSDATGDAPIFVGNISAELSGAGVLTLGTGHTVLFAGGIEGFGVTTSTGANLLRGTLVRGRGIAIHGDGSASVTGGTDSAVIALTTGANTIPAAFVGGRLIDVRIEAANYDERFLLYVQHNGFGSAGYSVTLATIVGNNTAGYGTPAFSVDTSGRLIITNASYPGSGVTATLCETQTSNSVQGSSQQQF